jgi:hypothetical protein
MDFKGLILWFINLLSSVVPIIFGLGLIYFFWGMVRYISSNEEGAKGGGKSTMVWGLIGLFVMSCVYGILSLLKSSFF